VFIATARPVHVAFGATLEEALKSLKGLAAKERQARVEREARKEASFAGRPRRSSLAEPSLQAFRKRCPGIQIEYMRQSGRVLAERIVREHRGKTRHRYRRHQRGHVCGNERRGRDRALCVAGSRATAKGHERSGRLVGLLFRHLRRGGTLRAQLVGAGEESCGLGVYLNNVHELLEPGAPVNYLVPEPVLVVPVINMMGKLAPHPYTAILLYDFILTPEAMGHYTRANAMAPARDNLPLVQAVRDLQGKRVYVIDVEASSRDYEKTVKEYRSLLKK